MREPFVIQWKTRPETANATSTPTAPVITPPNSQAGPSR
jgi:hypothetical protein